MAINTSFIRKLDRIFISDLHKWSIPTLRVCLGLVFLWFGLLKVMGISPVVDFINATYGWMPDGFITFLGYWEIVVGLGLIFKLFLRATLALLWLQMAGTFFSLIELPSMFFTDLNVFKLTLEGEFVIKNLVLVAAGLVIGGYEVKPK